MSFDRDGALARAYARIDELEETLRQTKSEAFASDVIFDRNIGLTGKEEAMLRVLARAAPRPVSRENLFAACWGDAERGWSGVERLLCRVRRKLAARGVTLRNDWGRDWWIDKADVAGLLERPQ